YAPARFLLVQVYDQQGKLTDAVKRAEELVSLNVNDVGALFQLGFLYYKNNQFEQAKPAFERAIELSPNYSNARYFLGLIYDKNAQMSDSSSAKATEDRNKAIEEFRKIAELNPDNAEIKQIVANLTAKKPALFGVTPPAPAPQNRAEAPISEGTKAPVQKLQK
ncbi:MAG: tetratricopeptide repeat protein, partial [Patescibacteria group bacterium]